MLNGMLINPPQSIHNTTMPFGIYLPLGLLSVAASINEHVRVLLYGCIVESFKELRFGDFTYYGTPQRIIEEKIREFKPDFDNLKDKDLIYSACSRESPLISINKSSVKDIQILIQYLKRKLLQYYIQHPLCFIRKAMHQPKSVFRFLNFVSKSNIFDNFGFVKTLMTA